MELRRADEIAEELVAMLRPGCARIEIAGSIRRRQAEVKDLDLVVEAQTLQTPDSLFGDGPRAEVLTQHLSWLARKTCGMFRKNPNHPACGARHKRAIWRDLSVELWIVSPPACWGNVLAIRTGPGDFSRWLVTPRSRGGALPEEYTQRDGALWTRGGERIICDTEREFFEVLGLPYWHPAERTEARGLVHIQNERNRHAGA